MFTCQASPHSIHGNSLLSDYKGWLWEILPQPWKYTVKILSCHPISQVQQPRPRDVKHCEVHQLGLNTWLELACCPSLCRVCSDFLEPFEQCRWGPSPPPAAGQPAAGLFSFVSSVRASLPFLSAWMRPQCQGTSCFQLPSWSSEREGAERSDVAQRSVSDLAKRTFWFQLIWKIELGIGKSNKRGCVVMLCDLLPSLSKAGGTGLPVTYAERWAPSIKTLGLALIYSGIALPSILLFILFLFCSSRE